MIRLIEPDVHPGPQVSAVEGFRLKIVLEGTKPKIWRELIVPAEASFGWLHAAIQVAMGWTNSHLHLFKTDTTVISDSGFELEQMAGGPPVTDEEKVQLKELFPEGTGTCIYEYDFGDSWMHQITFKPLAPGTEMTPNSATCVGGARPCPPEDCGGIRGYANLLKILKDPSHPEHISMRLWLGGPLNQTQFDREDINHWLSKLRWPKVTQAGLRKILKGRDRDKD